MLIKIVARFAAKTHQLTRDFADSSGEKQLLAFANADRLPVPREHVYISQAFLSGSAEFCHCDFYANLPARLGEDRADGSVEVQSSPPVHRTTVFFHSPGQEILGLKRSKEALQIGRAS